MRDFLGTGTNDEKFNEHGTSSSTSFLAISGPDQRFWERQCSTRTTEVLCVDIDGAVPADLHDKNTFAYFLTLCASGHVKAIIGGPPCRTISALRYQNDGGPANSKEFSTGTTLLRLDWPMERATLPGGHAT